MEGTPFKVELINLHISEFFKCQQKLHLMVHLKLRWASWAVSNVWIGSCETRCESYISLISFSRGVNCKERMKLVVSQNTNVFSNMLKLLCTPLSVFWTSLSTCLSNARLQWRLKTCAATVRSLGSKRESTLQRPRQFQHPTHLQHPTLANCPPVFIIMPLFIAQPFHSSSCSLVASRLMVYTVLLWCTPGSFLLVNFPANITLEFT